AAASTSLNVDSEPGALVGSTSTATRVAPGTSSRRSSNRFAAISSLKILKPVRLPPGRARLATRPSLTGSSAEMKTMGIVVVAALAANAALAGAAITATYRRTNSQPIYLALRPAVVDHHVLALDIAGVFEALAECAQAVRV